MRVAEGLTCDVEIGQKGLIVGVLAEFEGLAFKKRNKRKYIEKLMRDPEVDLIDTTHSGTKLFECTTCTRVHA